MKKSKVFIFPCQYFKNEAHTDHLGNVRVRYVDKDNDGEITVDTENLEANEIIGSYHYYPFGQLMVGVWNTQQGNNNRYQYNDD